MTAFVLLAVLLAALALGFIVTPLLRRRAQAAENDRSDANAAIYRAQLAELEAERAQGVISAERFDETRAEIERRLAEDLASGEAPGNDAKLQWRGSRLALVLGLVVPLLAGALYLLVGTPGALDPTAHSRSAQQQHEVTPEQIEAMVAQLAERLEREPNNPEGWRMLARSQAALERYAESAQAYAKLIEYGGKDAGALADYADVLAMAAGRDLRGEPYRLIQQALELDPDHVKALALAGTAEFHLGNYDAAIVHWERLIKTLPPESPLAEGVRSGLASARERAGRAPLAAAPAAPAAPSAPAAAAGVEAVQGIVMLDGALAANVKPDDVVFVLARPADGSRMPLAVKRIAVRDLPYAFRLDDTMAMAPGAKLSLHPRVIVTARVSRAGSAAPQKGDLEGASDPIAPGTSGIQITISKVIE
ncbi:MAG: c-type cytochrome biogenesis protein CcmI [bacterium]|jgi:cytochrome c-type biogenesis protein CcmH